MIRGQLTHVVQKKKRETEQRNKIEKIKAIEQKKEIRHKKEVDQKKVVEQKRGKVGNLSKEKRDVKEGVHLKSFGERNIKDSKTKKKQNQKHPKTYARKHYEAGKLMNYDRDYYEDERWLNYNQNYHNYQRSYDHHGSGASNWRQDEV